MSLIDQIPHDTLSSMYVGSIIDILDDMGLPRTESYAFLGVTQSQLSSPKLRIATNEAVALFKLAERRLKNSTVGLEVGFRFRVATFSETGTVLSYCSSLREAAEMNARYEPLTETAGKSKFISEGERRFLQWSPVTKDHQARRHVTELIIGGYAATIHWLGWSFGIPTGEASFCHAAPDDDRALATYKRILHTVPKFESAHNRFEFGQGTTELELPTSSPENLEDLCSRLDKLLFGSSKPGDLEHLTKRLRDGLEEGLTTREDLAKALELSVYQLDKSLSDAGTSFRAILDEVRKEEFQRLAARGVSLSEISYALGFNDQSAFTRAFQRWYGVTPGKYRPRF
jgi:AraC-like DNA-binding protein